MLAITIFTTVIHLFIIDRTSQNEGKLIDYCRQRAGNDYTCQEMMNLIAILTLWVNNGYLFGGTLA